MGVPQDFTPSNSCEFSFNCQPLIEFLSMYSKLLVGRRSFPFGIKQPWGELLNFMGCIALYIIYYCLLGKL